ncbi:hypothetical protein BGZ76_002850, partial [Entomortierella beljakovae]
QDLQNRWFDFGADSHINTYQHIRLTQDLPSQSGWLWSRLPLTQPNYQIEFEFKVGGKGSGIVGDGFAVWLTELGPVFGSRDNFHGLGVFFDTYANKRGSRQWPYVMAMNGDGATYDNDNDGEKNEIGGCHSNFRDRSIPTKGRLTYSEAASTVKLQLQVDDENRWDDCFTLFDIKLPVSPYLGFTAHTGEVHDAHDIISVSTTAIEKAEHIKPQQSYNTSPPRSRSGNSGFFGALKFIAGSVVFVGVVYAAYKFSQKKDHNKRF